ncbi:MAG: histidinol-phosphate transaminase [Methanobacteriota archaeon]
MKFKVREEIRQLKKAIHGGEVWSFSDVKIDFSSNINPLGPSRKAIEAAKNSLWKCAYYPDSNTRELKKALSEYLGVSTENIIVGNGSTELIKNFCEAFINKGDEILIPQPTYSDYEVYARLYGAKIAFVPDKKIISTIDSKTRAIFVCNPNNPTGRTIEIEEIIEKAHHYSALVFLDEAYTEFTDQESFCSRIEDFENLFVLRSLTKFFALPGLRMGYGVGNKKIIECLEKLRLPWNLNTLAQVAAIESIKDGKYIRESKKFMKKERNFLYKELSKIQKLKVSPSEANFFLIDLRKAGIKASTAKKKLIEKGMLIRDCRSFRGLNEYFIRACVRNRKENARLIKELKNIVGE